MAGRGASGDWLIAEELFERGDPAFVEAIRRLDDAEALGAFAPRWVADRRPEARALLFDYLDRPLNAYRHEALVKRAFKAAEAAGDDALMARFLVAFDRAIRRIRRTNWRYEYREVDTEAEANALAASLGDGGLERVSVLRDWRKKYQVSGRRRHPVVVTPSGTAMPRGTPMNAYTWDPATRKGSTFKVPDWVYRLSLIPDQFRENPKVPEGRRKDFAKWRLFSIATRRYLRRRAWRYFRKLGRRDPGRYVPSVSGALLCYRDEDAADGLALIDNWGLVHILFHHSPVLVADERCWTVAGGRSLAELEPAPMFARLWAAAPRSVVDLLIRGRCRAIRGWAVGMIRRDPSAFLPVFPLEERLDLLADDDPVVVGLAADLLRDDPGLAAVPVGRWLGLLESTSAAGMDVLCDVVGRLVTPDRVAMADAVRLARVRPLPVARLGLEWLRTKAPRDEAECQALLGLVEADSEPLRPELLRWARETLSASSSFRPDWVLAWLDSRHADARAEGWSWFLAEPRVRDDVTTWRRLMESPYDDVRLALVAELESRAGDPDDARLERDDLDPHLLRLLWASVLLNVHRGHRAKPLAVRQLLRRAESRPADLPALLPLLAVALRSVRGPEFRAGLAAVVGLAERDVEARGLIERAFPELQLA